ncbi:MAG: LPS assembly lipoprotein LptE [Longimicrobiales bacterium]|nr:LPS assembly lipoprotein LptE [Longimicrobiales bacterium]
MSSPSRLTSGATSLALLLASVTTGCFYGFSSGTGLSGVDTMAVTPCENETRRLELATELYDVMFQQLPARLGLQIAGEDVADIIVRCVIRDYVLDTPNFRTRGEETPEILQRQVTVRAAVQIIDQRDRVVLWEDRSLQAEGQYLEASENEEIGRAEAFQLLVQRILDGAQSNW